MNELTEGFVTFRGMRTAYRVVGDGGGPSGRAPLLMVHGGPGSPWWRPRADEQRLLESGGRPVVFYDQLGCGRSDRPTDPSLWTVGLFVEELAAVRNELNLGRLHLYGWSWGGMLVLEYLLTRPHGVISAVLVGTPYSVPALMRDVRRLRSELPQRAEATLQRFERHYRPRAARPAPRAAAKPGLSSAQVDARIRSLRVASKILSTPAALRLASGASRIPALRGAAASVAELAFVRACICRLDPLPDQLLELSAGENRSVMEALWGPSQAFSSGSLIGWDVSERLKEIDTPVLVVSGRHDVVTPTLAEGLRGRLPDAGLLILENSSHTGMLEEPERHWSEVFAFLEQVEAA